MGSDWGLQEPTSSVLAFIWGSQAGEKTSEIRGSAQVKIQHRWCLYNLTPLVWKVIEPWIIWCSMCIFCSIRSNIVKCYRKLQMVNVGSDWRRFFQIKHQNYVHQKIKMQHFAYGSRIEFSCCDAYAVIFHRILLFHTHSLRQPLAHFLDPPSLPPEDLEPVPEKHVKHGCLCIFFVFVCHRAY